MCTRTVSVLAHVFEQAGFATVGISLVEGQARRGRAPRLLHCEFPLGRPLGRPGDAAFQHRVLAAAFSLLARTDVPVLETFPETIEDASDQPLACALPPRLDTSLHPAVEEAIGLRPAFERARAAQGGTADGHAPTSATGPVGSDAARGGAAASSASDATGGRIVAQCDPDAVAGQVSVFASLAAGTPWASLGIGPADLAASGTAVRAYYETAALGLADHVPAARQAESWLYQVTETGKVLRAAQAALRAAEAPREAWARLVPAGQPPAGQPPG